jgi:DNA-binding protein HU-beta
MNREDLSVKVAKETGLTRAEADKAVKATIGAIAEAAHGGDKVTLAGFGTFNARTSKATTRRMPDRDGGVRNVEVPARRVLHFKPSKQQRDDLD